MTTANVIAVRVKDWPPEKKLPPWKTGSALCNFCGEEVIVSPEYIELLKSIGLEIKYICNQYFSIKSRMAG